MITFGWNSYGNQQICLAIHPLDTVILHGEDPVTVTFQLHIRSIFSRISNVTQIQHLAALPIKKNSRLLSLVKNYLGLKTPSTPVCVDALHWVVQLFN
jgi:hypothetical protein